MKIIPYERYSFDCSLTQEQVSSKFKDNTEPKNLFRIGRSNKAFEGNISNDFFELRRIITYRNSFLPQIKGSFIEKENNTTIKLSMKLHPFVIVFMFLWFTGVIISCAITLPLFFNKISVDNILDFGLLLPVGMLLFGIALCLIPFWIEVNKAKYEINKIFSVHMI